MEIELSAIARSEDVLLLSKRGIREKVKDLDGPCNGRGQSNEYQFLPTEVDVLVFVFVGEGDTIEVATHFHKHAEYEEERSYNRVEGVASNHPELGQHCE